jgi:formylglycine-generating enzyme required for sulfatase activity/dienelactone hydrolase
MDPGTTLAHYVIEELLGEGGMGQVYRARDTVLNRTVAIKVLAPTPSGESESKRRLLREARAVSALNHHNVVTIHSVEEQGGVDFIVMEHVSGTPLVIPPGGLPIDVGVQYAIQIAEALAAAHEAGIVHRDIKPQNVMIGRTGHVKVLDFGIARRTAIEEDAATRPVTLDRSIAATGVVVGTIGYLAPEQIEGKPADARSDVFSLGALLYEMFTGRRAFDGASGWAVMDATMRSEPPLLTTVRPDAPVGLAHIVRRCLSKDPDGRYQSAIEVRDDLSSVRARQGMGTADGKRRTGRIVIAAGIVLALAGAGALTWSRASESRLKWAHDVAVPEIIRLADAGEMVKAYRLGQRARQAAPDDAEILDRWNGVTTASPITSDPPGADVAFREYSGADEGWIGLGRTPVNARHPMGLLRWRVAKDGFDSVEIAPDHPGFHAALVPRGTTPAGMVFVPGGTFELESSHTEVKLAPYWLDKYEVTNRAFKEFVDKGGYRDPKYWGVPFVRDGLTLSWAVAMNESRDRTGRPGPATRELGSYPDGQEDYPVSGVSWYEAAAFARFAGKELPTVYHWYNASGAFGVFSEILHFSNFGGKGPLRVGSTGGLGPYGTYDMAGNVKEWTWNEALPGQRYVLGGGFNEPAYTFRDEDAQSAFDRRAGIGFRCMRQRSGDIDHSLLSPIPAVSRPVSALKPVSDEVYEAYRHLYDYDRSPLDGRVEEVEMPNPHWQRERVSFRASYGNERVPAYLFEPRDFPPPYQTVVYFPGSDAARLRSSRGLYIQFIEFLVRSGRAVIYPVYKQTYERRVDVQPGQGWLREISIQRGQDVRRTIDYLETRPDVDRTRIAFYGVSLGAQLAPVYLAIEPRFRTGVLLSGGFETWTIPPETDPVNFAPHVKQPVLMVNGRDDFDLPYATAQVPLFQALGTPAADKRHAVLEGGHIPPRPQDVFKEILDWLDRYLGPVQK